VIEHQLGRPPDQTNLGIDEHALAAAPVALGEEEGPFAAR
jgi:hypothetical protein